MIFFDRIFKARRIVIGLMLVGGCASVPKDAGFSDVQKSVMDRAGQQVQWNRGEEADRRVADAVNAILRREMSADDAAQVALLNNQNLQATYEDLGVAQAELVEAGLLKNPTLSAEIRFPRRPKFPFEVDVTEDFLELFFIPLRKRAAGAAFEAAKLRVTDEVLRTVAETKIAFYRAQAAEQLLDVRHTAVAAFEASFDAATKLHDAGNITDLALAEQRAMYEQAKIELARADADVQDAREEVNAMMGAWGEQTRWTIPARLADLPKDEIELTGLESLAVANRVDLSAARQDIERAAQSLGLTKYSALIPDASVTAHAEGEPDGTTTVGPGITLPLPIFNQGQPAIAAAQARLRQSQRKYTALAVQIRSDVRRARNKMIIARDLADHYIQVVIPLRHEIVGQKQLEYNAMVINVFQLLQAKRDEIEAGRESVEALRDYWVARTELERAVGGRLKAANISPATMPTTSPTTRANHPTPSVSHEHDQHGEHP